jgi:hypothetical protein
LADPIVLRLVRPYDSEEDYLAAEAWTIDAKGMLLVDQPVLPSGTVVRFDITLRNGAKVIRAEGKVVGVAAARRERPGGLKVRFKRFGGSTKTLIDRVVAERKNDEELKKSERAPAVPIGRLTLETLSDVDVSDLDKTEPMPPVESRRAPSPPPPPPPPREPQPRRSPPPRAPSDARPGPVAAPPNREELLERLRARARTKASS